MTCNKCNSPINEGSKFCGVCGTSVTPAPSVNETETPSPSVENGAKTTETPELSNQTSPASKKEKRAKKEKKKKKISAPLIICLCVVAALIIGIGVVAYLMFPSTVEVTDPNETETTDGYIDEAVFLIKANQPIKEIKYALNPENSDDLSLYTEIEGEGGAFEKEVSFSDLQVLPGENVMYIYVKTMFGEYTHNTEFECNVGYTGDLDLNSIIEVEENVYAVYNELLITFNDSVSGKKAKELISEHGGTVVGEIHILNMYQARFEGLSFDEVSSVMETLSASEGVENVSLNLVEEGDVSKTPNDSEYDSWKVSEPGGNNWGLECIDAPGAWEYQDKMSSVNIGVIDSFVNYAHEDLDIDSSEILFNPSADFKKAKELKTHFETYKDNHNCPYDNLFNQDACEFCDSMDHGTHVSGIIGAVANNKKGVSGVSWNTNLKFATAWEYSINSDNNVTSYSSMMEILYDITSLAMSRCRVINMSIGSSTPSAVYLGEQSTALTFENMFKKLEEDGYDFIVIKAAGNSNDDASNYMLNRLLTTGDYAGAHTVIVASVDHAGVDFTPFDFFPTKYGVAKKSNYGSIVDIAAPGTNIYSTVFDGYGNMSGTSMAAPMVSGVAGMLYSLNPDLKYGEVKDILISQTDKYTAKKEISYPIVNAKLAVEYLLDNGPGNPEANPPEAGFVSGMIQDAVTEELIPNAVVVITNAEGVSENALIIDGVYYYYAEPGVYTMTFEAPDYITETIHGIEITNGVVNYNVLLNMVPEEEEPGVVSGRIVDAFDASSIANASIEIYRGVNSTTGTPVMTATSDEGGNYEVTLEPGNYTLKVSAADYSDGVANVISVSGTTRYNQDCTLTPHLGEGEIRAVLTWGASPRDLDSHMSGPAVNGRFHTYYSEKNHSYNGTHYVNLDVDDTTSYGPETTSVYVGLDGEYRFYVHDFTNRGSSYSTEMATSGAKVTVYVGGDDRRYEFNVPNEDGTVWEVFSIENGVLTPINYMFYESDPSAIG